MLANIKLMGDANVFWNNILAKKKRFGRNLLTLVEIKDILRTKYYPMNHDKNLHK